MLPLTNQVFNNRREKIASVDKFYILKTNKYDRKSKRVKCRNSYSIQTLLFHHFFKKKNESFVALINNNKSNKLKHVLLNSESGFCKAEA